jgi:hypothetical protein
MNEVLKFKLNKKKLIHKFRFIEFTNIKELFFIFFLLFNFFLRGRHTFSVVFKLQKKDKNTNNKRENSSFFYYIQVFFEEKKTKKTNKKSRTRAIQSDYRPTIVKCLLKTDLTFGLCNVQSSGLMFGSTKITT